MNALLKLLSYPKSIIASIFLPLWTAFVGLVSIVSVSLTRSQRVGDYCIYVWAKAVIWINNIDLKVEGLGNLPEDGCIFVFNHTSDFDIPIFHASHLKHVRFGAKIELFKIPIMKQAMNVMGVLPIVRGDRDKVLKLYEKSKNRVIEGKESFILAGEGTRMTRPGVGDKFKAGPFIFAIHCGAPVVPFVIVGAHEILPKNKRFSAWGVWKPKVLVKILPPQDSRPYSLDTRKNFQEQVRQMMSQAYTEGLKEWSSMS